MPIRRIELMQEVDYVEDDRMADKPEKVEHKLHLTPDPDHPGQGTFVVDQGPRKIGKAAPHTGKGRLPYGGGTPRTIGQASPPTKRTHIWWRKPGE